MAERTENDALIEVARTAAEPTEIGDGLYAVATSDGGVKVIDVEEETEYRDDAPRRKTGARSVADAESLVEYLRRHATTLTEVWADLLPPGSRRRRSARSADPRSTAGSCSGGKTTIPSRLSLALRPFVGGPRVLVEAALRFRVTRDESVTLGWVLINPRGILDTAFENYVDAIRTGLASIDGEDTGAITIPLFLGKVTKAR